MDNKIILKRLAPIASMAVNAEVDIDIVDNHSVACMHLGVMTHTLDTIALMIGQIIDEIEEEEREWEEYLKKREGEASGADA